MLLNLCSIFKTKINEKMIKYRKSNDRIYLDIVYSGIFISAFVCAVCLYLLLDE